MAEKQAPNKLLLIVGAVAVLGAGGWFAWQQFMTEPPPPPPPKAVAKSQAAPTPASAPAAAPVAAAAANPDKQIEDILAVSGLGHTLQRLPEQLLASVRQAGEQDRSGKLRKADLQEMERLTREAYTAQGFRLRVTTQLKKQYDARRFQEFLDDSATPLAKRMSELEKQEPGQAEMLAYMKALAAKPLPPERVRLIERIDAASRASELALEAMFSSVKGMMRGFAGADAKQLAEIDKAIEQQRTAAAGNVRNAVRLSLAYTYRDVGDADLAEYARLHEKDSTKYFLGLVFDALIEEIRAGAERFGAGLEKLFKARFEEQLAAKAKGKPAPKAAAKAEAPAAAAPRGDRSRMHEDARECLRFEANRQVMGCAERYR
jgi:hypothetical protein